MMSDKIQKFDQAIEIDPDGKYILLISGTSIDDLKEAGERVERIVQAWLRREGDPILVLGATDVFEIKLVRIDEEDEQ